VIAVWVAITILGVVFVATSFLFYMALRGVLSLINGWSTQMSLQGKTQEAIVTELEKYGQIDSALIRRVTELERVGVATILGNVRGKEEE